MAQQIECERAADFARGVTVYIDGKESAYPAESEYFRQFCVKWKEMMQGAHKMPAFGVSLNGDTVKAMQEGVWAEFFFGGTYISDGMSYEKLLFCVRAEWSGFNIVRYNGDCGYEGRCFYYSLANDMSGLYAFITANK